MSKKNIDEIIIDTCEGAREATSYFKQLTDEAYIAHQTAMIKILNPSLSVSFEEVSAKISELLSKSII